MTSSAAVCHFPSPRPCVPTEENKRARSDNLSLTSSDIMSSKSLMSYTSLYWGRSRLPALAVTPRCTTRASVSTLRGGRKSGRPGSSRPGGSGMIARVSGCESRAPVHPLFVRQRRRPLRREQQTEQKRITHGTSKTRSRAHADHLQTVRRARTHAILRWCTRKSFVGALWRRIFVVAELTRYKNSLAFARHLPPNQPILR